MIGAAEDQISKSNTLSVLPKPEPKLATVANLSGLVTTVCTTSRSPRQRCLKYLTDSYLAILPLVETNSSLTAMPSNLP